MEPTWTGRWVGLCSTALTLQIVSTCRNNPISVILPQLPSSGWKFRDKSVTSPQFSHGLIDNNWQTSSRGSYGEVREKSCRDDVMECGLDWAASDASASTAACSAWAHHNTGPQARRPTTWIHSRYPPYVTRDVFKLLVHTIMSVASSPGAGKVNALTAVFTTLGCKRILLLLSI